jgi:hypothetical protein
MRSGPLPVRARIDEPMEKGPRRNRVDDQRGGKANRLFPSGICRLVRLRQRPRIEVTNLAAQPSNSLGNSAMSQFVRFAQTTTSTRRRRYSGGSPRSRRWRLRNRCLQGLPEFLRRFKRLLEPPVYFPSGPPAVTLGELPDQPFQVRSRCRSRWSSRVPNSSMPCGRRRQGTQLMQERPHHVLGAQAVREDRIRTGNEIYQLLVTVWSGPSSRGDSAPNITFNGAWASACFRASRSWLQQPWGSPGDDGEPPAGRRGPRPIAFRSSRRKTNHCPHWFRPQPSATPPSPSHSLFSSMRLPPLESIAFAQEVSGRGID